MLYTGCGRTDNLMKAARSPLCPRLSVCLSVFGRHGAVDWMLKFTGLISVCVCPSVYLSVSFYLSPSLCLLLCLSVSLSTPPPPPLPTHTHSPTYPTLNAFLPASPTPVSLSRIHPTSCIISKLMRWPVWPDVPSKPPITHEPRFSSRGFIVAWSTFTNTNYLSLNRRKLIISATAC